MSKMQYHDNEGFAILMPRSQGSTNSIHERDDWDDVPESNLLDYYKRRCDDLEETVRQLRHDNEVLNETIDTQQQTIATYREMMKSSQEQSMVASLDDPIVEGESPFNFGVGLRFGHGQNPELYRLSDPDGKSGKRKFKGGRLELSPGHGFRIGLDFEKED